MDKDTIRKAAENLRKGLALEAPASVEQLVEAVKKLGGKVVDDVGDEEASIVKTGQKQFLVRVDPSKPDVRRTFSIAHELGHLFLHMGYLQPRWNDVKEYVESYARLGYTSEEFEANEFAGALLMPGAEFKELVERGYQVGDIADHFGVSQDAASTRGKWLQLYSW